SLLLVLHLGLPAPGERQHLRLLRQAGALLRAHAREGDRVGVLEPLRWRARDGHGTRGRSATRWSTAARWRSAARPATRWASARRSAPERRASRSAAESGRADLVLPRDEARARSSGTEGARDRALSRARLYQLVGFPGSYNQTSKKWARSRPESRSA